MDVKKVDSINDAIEKANTLYEIILLSRRKREIIKAFKDLLCLITGKCICDMCESWDKNTYIVFEFGRCFVPSRLMQLIKERHFGTKRWEYIQPMYAQLYETVYEDLDPTSGVIHSSGVMEDQACAYKLSPSTIERSIELIKTQQRKKRV